MLPVVGAAVALLLAGCGGADDAAPERDRAAGPGLAVRIAGVVDGELLCPGGRRPCLPVDGSIEPASDGTAWVSGHLTDEALIVDEQLTIPEPADRVFTNRCPDQEIDGQPPAEVVEALHEDPSARPPGYVDLWESDDGVLHLGVTGDPAPARALLDELGVADQVCLVTGFPHTDAILETVQREVADAAQRAGHDGFGVGRDAWEGTVTIDLLAFDRSFRTRLDQISEANGDVPIVAMAGVEVIDGSLADYEAALAIIAVAPEPDRRLTASCGPVEFSSIPPDLDEFPPLDADAKAAIDELVSGPTGVEAGGFDTGVRWSIASRTEDQLVLFGQGDGPDGPALLDARFERRDGVWTPTAWGGCRVEIGALGLGPARLALDPDAPPDPDGTELPILINERNCASGQAPIDREIVPIVTETDTSVTIIVLVAPVEGGAECPGNPWHPITITLAAPLGSRQLLDGHEHPATPIGPVDRAD